MSTRHFWSSGILQAKSRAAVVAGVAGYVEDVLVESGDRVAEKQPLIRLRSVQLDSSVRALEAKLDALRIRRQTTRVNDPAYLRTLDRMLVAAHAVPGIEQPVGIALLGEEWLIAQADGRVAVVARPGRPEGSGPE